MIEGALILALGAILGWLGRGKQRKHEHRAEIQAEPKPICESCTHHRGLHKDGTGACAAVDNDIIQNSGSCQCGHSQAYHLSGSGYCNKGMCDCVKYHRKATSEPRPCKCQQYHGPQPFYGYYAPEITS